MGANDNFLANVPFFILFSHIFPMDRTTLFIEAALFAAINFTLFYLAGLYFLKRCKIRISYYSLMPFLWLSSFGFGFGQLFLNTDWRDFEAGVSFIYFMLVSKIYFDDVRPLRSWPSRLLTGLTCPITGLFMYSDPYFLYFTIVPIVALFFLLFMMKKVSRQLFLVIMSSALLGIVLARVIAYGATKAGLLIPAGNGIVLSSLRSTIPNIGHALAGLLMVFGAASFDKPFLSVATASNVCDFVLVGFILYCLYQSRPSRNMIDDKSSNPLALTGAFFAFLTLVIICAYTFSNVTVVDNYRYLFLAIFACTLLLSLRSGMLEKGRHASMFVLVLATTLNIVTSYTGASSVHAEALTARPNAQNAALINTVRGLGLIKGYTNYWDGNINTYLSAGKIEFLPVGCSNGKTEPLNLLVDSSLFDRAATRSFFVEDRINNGAEPACNGRQVLTQFGIPSQELKVPNSNYTVFVYDYDIVTKMTE